MKIIESIALFVFFLPFLGCGEIVTVDFFYSKDCLECQKITHLFLPALQDEKGDRFNLVLHELGDQDNFQRLLFHLDNARDKSNETMYAVVNNSIILGGAKAIENNLSSIIDAEFTGNHSFEEYDSQTPQKTADRFTIATVLTAGFIDGINPCVFAAFILCASFLATGKSGRKQLWGIGLTYIAGVFLTYFSLGLGVYGILTFAVSFALLRGIVNSMTILLLLFFAVISFWDAIRYSSVGIHGVVLQLPQGLKEIVRKAMRRSQRQAFILPAVFACSVLVTIVESACSGQVYVPTLLYLADNTGGFNQWWGYLLLYNLMFLIPLTFIFAIAVFSIKTRWLAKLSRINVLVSKTIMGLLFLFLAALIGYLEFCR